MRGVTARRKLATAVPVSVESGQVTWGELLEVDAPERWHDVVLDRLLVAGPGGLSDPRWADVWEPPVFQKAADGTRGWPHERISLNSTRERLAPC
jgi:hypothetical protein